MHNGRKLVSDTFSDVYGLLEPWIDHGFWDFGRFEPEPNSICVVGRHQAVQCTDHLKSLCDRDCVMVFANTAEGSETQISVLRMLGLEDLVRSGRLLLLSGGRMSSEYPYLLHEHFLVRVVAYEENIRAMSRSQEIFSKTSKPYQFLFLNGRARPHRKYLWHRFDERGLLDKSIWSMMEGRGLSNRSLNLRRGGVDIMAEHVASRSLPAHYEVERYRDRSQVITDHHNIKFDVFDNEWGEIYIESAPYIDTYFSVITETILEGTHSFFTEKIAKPLAQGHPWIAATNSGFYRDLRALGFRTFDHVIDESFDSIDDDQSRMDRIVDVVTDLCQQDLDGFLAACEDVCKYNQLQLLEVARQENQLFPERFFQFIDQHA
jgi:hypothetical protein